MSAVTTLIGNATGDVELRFSQAGKAIGSVTVAVSDRVKKDGEWADGKTWFARCTIWGEMAEHAAASIHKGDRVIGFGRIEQRDWEDKEGNKRTTVEVTLDEIGPSLRYATAVVSRVQRGSGNQSVPVAAGIPDSWNEVANFNDESPF